MVTSRKPDEGDKAVGRELARLRKDAGLVQEQVAILIGVSAKQLSKYELGQNRISISRFEKVQRILRSYKQTTGGFAESQATYDGPPQTGEVVKIILREMQEEMSAFHRMEDKVKLCLDMLADKVFRVLGRPRQEMSRPT